MIDLFYVVVSIQLLFLHWLLQVRSCQEFKMIKTQKLYYPHAIATNRWFTIWLLNSVCIGIWVALYFLWSSWK